MRDTLTTLLSALAVGGALLTATAAYGGDSGELSGRPDFERLQFDFKPPAQLLEVRVK